MRITITLFALHPLCDTTARERLSLNHNTAAMLMVATGFYEVRRGVQFAIFAGIFFPHCRRCFLTDHDETA